MATRITDLMQDFVHLVEHKFCCRDKSFKIRFAFERTYFFSAYLTQNYQTFLKTSRFLRRSGMKPPGNIAVDGHNRFIFC